MDSEGREMLSKEDSAAIGALITEATGKFFVALRGSSRAVYPVKIEVVSGNGSILTGLLLDSDAEAVFGDASKSEMTFPLSLTVSAENAIRRECLYNQRPPVQPALTRRKDVTTLHALWLGEITIRQPQVTPSQRGSFNNTLQALGGLDDYFETFYTRADFEHFTSRFKERL